MPKYRTNADGSAVCHHRDLSVCPTCAAADPMLIEVVGVHYHARNAAEREAMLAVLAEDA